MARKREASCGCNPRIGRIVCRKVRAKGFRVTSKTCPKRRS